MRTRTRGGLTPGEIALADVGKEPNVMVVPAVVITAMSDDFRYYSFWFKACTGPKILIDEKDGIRFVYFGSVGYCNLRSTNGGSPEEFISNAPHFLPGKNVSQLLAATEIAKAPKFCVSPDEFLRAVCVASRMSSDVANVVADLAFPIRLRGKRVQGWNKAHKRWQGLAKYGSERGVLPVLIWPLVGQVAHSKTNRISEITDAVRMEVLPLFSVEVKLIDGTPAKATVCALCDASATPTLSLKACSICKTTFYCSQIHQKSHWEEHKSYCQNSADRLEKIVQRMSKPSKLYVNVFSRDFREVVYHMLPVSKVVSEKNVSDWVRGLTFGEVAVVIAFRGEVSNKLRIAEIARDDEERAKRVEFEKFLLQWDARKQHKGYKISHCGRQAQFERLLRHLQARFMTRVVADREVV
jgi:hypothetical protein